MKKILNALITLALLAAVVGVVYLAPIPFLQRTPTENKAIEVSAFEHKNKWMCWEIRGESYRFGPTDGQIAISQSEARSTCQKNIEDNITPVEHGG